MTTRKYSSRSQQTTLVSQIVAGATSATVVSATALLGGITVSAGQTFTVVIDPDTALEEIVDVTSVSANNLIMTRGRDGSTAQDHSAGAVVRHMAIGRDYRESNLHIEATGAYNDGTGTHDLHGIATGEGDVVGTAKTQTLTNKTLTAPKFADGGFLADANGNEVVILDSNTSAVNEITVANAATGLKPTISATGGDTNITLNLVSKGTGTVQANGVQVVDLSSTQTVTNKTLTSSTISVPALTLSTNTNTSEGRIAWDATNDQLKVGDGTTTRTISPDDKAATISNKTLGTNLAAGTFKITGLGDPTSAQDAATKNYVDTGVTSQVNQAAASATAAAASATSAAASFDSFDDRYLGAKASDPTLDNDGNALLTGALYFNTASPGFRSYTGSAWVTSIGPAGSNGAAGAGYSGVTSTTSLTIAITTKLFTLNTSTSAFTTGTRVRAANTTTPANYMEGIVTVSGTTMTMTVDAIGGSGTFAAWTMSVAGNTGTNGVATYDSDTAVISQQVFS